MVDFSFFSYERPVVAFLFFWLFWSYAPPLAPLPVADSAGVLARFDNATELGGVARPFFFGLATAAAHVEDQARRPAAPRAARTRPAPRAPRRRSRAARARQLEDGWLEFARAGKVAAFLNQERPEARNNFWTQPEVELDLAASTGVQARPARRLSPRRRHGTGCRRAARSAPARDRAAGRALR